MEKLLVINVLPKNTYDDCHIPGSKNIPLDELAAFAQDLKTDHPIVLYCASYICPASSRAWHKLNELGFTNIKAYEGGSAEWRQKGYPTEGACTLEYLKQKEEAQKRDIVSITAEELKRLMDEAGLLTSSCCG